MDRNICVVFYFYLFIYLFLLFRAAPLTYGGSSARGWTGDTAASVHHSHKQCQICAVSVTYTTVCSNARSLTHWMRPGIEPPSSWILIRFITHRVTTGTPWLLVFLYSFSNIYIYISTSAACTSSWPRDRTYSTAVMRTTAETMLDPWPTEPPRELPHIYFNQWYIGVPAVAQRKWTWLVSLRMWVPYLASHGGLRSGVAMSCVEVADVTQILHCHGCDVVGSHCSNSTHSPGTSVCYRCGTKNQKKKKRCIK